ncbi:hypothetical protein MUK42_34767 [Musa troglodytarum]|uniref:Uncharacterized protein n=1 Tax=Musa troglodytarum TaxID=320322 RepID=A0A9E7GIA2_9LILI|nr:hypothetical protein MUK42_34767 [Musa troglodytarum]
MWVGGASSRLLVLCPTSEPWWGIFPADRLRRTSGAKERSRSVLFSGFRQDLIVVGSVQCQCELLDKFSGLINQDTNPIRHWSTCTAAAKWNQVNQQNPVLSRQHFSILPVNIKSPANCAAILANRLTSFVITMIAK